MPSISPLHGFSTGTIVYCLEMHLGLKGYFMTGVAPATSTNYFAGRARTLRCVPTRADVVEARKRDQTPNPQRVAIDGTGEGEVLVIDARGVRDAAVLGDILCSRLKAVGAAGLVTDGAVRDLPGLEKLEFPIFSAGFHAATFGTRHLGVAVGEPVSCGGVLVMPGDVLVGDAEGVVVVPAELEQRVADLATEQDELDAFLLEKVAAGVPLSRAYPPDKTVRAEFEEQRRKQNAGGAAV